MDVHLPLFRVVAILVADGMVEDQAVRAASLFAWPHHHRKIRWSAAQQRCRARDSRAGIHGVSGLNDVVA
ncbi:hypothetical protein [Streptomyces chartreusis]|uniref:hypothetical protein n=1 Tax=Streptomyces chartreusis TaxID=1969 RepID=UPI003808783B